MTEKNTKKKLSEVGASGDFDHHILKTIEELSELNTRLAQFLNGKRNITPKKISSEIADVKVQLDIIQNAFDKKAVKRSYKKKAGKRIRQHKTRDHE